MEALTAVSIALLTIYDMCKAVDKSMEIKEIKLLKKTKQAYCIVMKILSVNLSEAKGTVKKLWSPLRLTNRVCAGMPMPVHGTGR